MSRLRLSSTRKIIFASLAFFIVLAGSIASVFLVFASQIQDISSQIEVNYISDGVGAEVSATYTSLPNNLAYATAAKKNQMTDGQNHSVIVFDESEQSGQQVAGFLTPGAIAFNVENPRVVFEYKIKDTAMSRILINLGSENISANNVKIRYKTSCTELSVDEYCGLFNDSFTTQVFLPQPILDIESEDRIVYFYISVEVDDLTSSANYTGTLSWSLTKILQSNFYKCNVDDTSFAGSLDISTSGQNKTQFMTGATTYAMPIMFNLPEVESAGNKEFCGYYKYDSSTSSYEKYIDYDGSSVHACDLTTNDTLYAKYGSTLFDLTSNNHISGVTFKGSCASEIVVPSNVTHIDDEAFANCTNLKVLDIESSSTTFGTSILEGCSSLKELTIPAPATSASTIANYFGTASMQNSYKVSGRYIPNNLKKLTILAGSNVVASGGVVNSYYSNYTSLTSIRLGEGITELESYSFASCSTLTEIILSDSLTTIGVYAFDRCQSLIEIDIPDGVKVISNGLFYECYNLKHVDYADDARFDGQAIFWDCISLEEIKIPSGTTNWESQYVGSFNQFYRCKSVKKVTILTTDALGSCLRLLDQIEELILAEEPADSFASYFETVPSSLSKITILGGTVNGHFRDYPNIEVVFGDGITGIGESTFEGCLFSEFDIPANVTSIGDYAFSGCVNLTSINIPANVTSIGDYVFGDCVSLTSINIPANVTSIGDSAFSGCINLTSINLPSSLTTIGEYAFESCQSLSQINLPPSLTTIGQFAFYECMSLTRFVIPNNVSTINNGTFRNCYSLTSLTIGSGVTSIPGKGTTFSGCYNLVEICNLSSLNIVAGETTYLKVALYAKDVYTTEQYTSKLVASNGVIYYVDGGTKLAVASTDIYCSKIVLDNDCTGINDNAFYPCYGITSLTIGQNVSQIGDNIFEDCFRLFEIYNLSSLSITAGSSDYGGVAEYAEDVYSLLSSQSKLETINGVIYYIDGGSKMAIGPENLNCTSVVVDADCTEIMEYGFDYCYNLREVVILAGVIGKGAFYDCGNLTNVTIGNGVSEITARTFSKNDLTEVVFEDLTHTWNVGTTTITISDLSDSELMATYLCSKYATSAWTKNS